MKDPHQCGCSRPIIPKNRIDLKFFIMLVWLICLQVSVKAETQKMSVAVRNATFDLVIRQISEQTGKQFIYNNELIKKAHRVTLNISSDSLEEILQVCFTNQPFTYKFLENTIVIVPLGEGRKSSDLKPTKEVLIIKGQVKDQSGEALPGVNIMVKGTTRGGTTDVEGKYEIEVAGKESVLKFSYVGYISQEMMVGHQTVVNVTLQPDVQALGEVVVIGYGTMKKKDLTGAVGLVAGKDLENQAAPSLGQALQGKMAGLNIRQVSGSPNAGTEIRIRGMGSFGASAAPLVVIDGIITNGGLSDLDPASVESVTVLKDASSAAIYGSRGANGVLLVTTKRGKAGKENISFQAYQSFDQVIKKIETVDATTYGEMVNDFYVNQGKQAPYLDTQSLGKGTNWQDEIFRTGRKSNYSLSFNGGTEKSLHALILSYYKGEGIVLNSKYNRANVRINNDIKPLNGLKIGTSLALSYGVSKQGDPQGAVNASLIYAPNVVPYNSDGSYGIANRAGQPTTMTAPLVAAYERVNEDYRLGLLGNLYLEYEILNGLKFKSSLGAEYINQDSKGFVPSYNFGLGNVNGVATLNRNLQSTKNYMIDNILTYHKNFSAGHDLDVMAGYTFQDERYEFVRAFRNTFSRNSEELQVLDAATSNDQARGNYTEWALQSYLGRINYGFQEKYYLSSSIRVDQSSRFIKSQRTGVFPSFSLGWVLSKEAFLAEKLGPVSLLKLRFGYGSLGNQDVGIYPYQSLINYNLNYDFGTGQNVVAGAAPTVLANQNITWEKTSTTGLGLEMNLWQDRLGVVVDLYDRRTTDVLVRVPLPNISGMATYPYQNVGGVRNHGFEVTLNYQDSNADQTLRYSAGVNLTVNNNVVSKLDKGLDIIQAGGGQGGVETRISQGHGINAFYGYLHDGIFQNDDEVAQSAFQPNAAPGDIRFKDLNGDGVINDQDRAYIGNFLAKQSVGFNGSLQYKAVDFSFSMVGDFGRSQNIFASGFAAARAAESTNAMWAERWTGPGTSNYVPRIIGGDPNGNSRSSDFWVRSQDYLRVQNLQLGYDLSQSIGKKIGVQKARLYLAGQNLFTFTKFPGFDPETTATAYPIPKSIFIGLNLSF